MANGAPTVSNGLVISGVTTVTTLDLNGDLDVDGHLNADNVSIAGVVTATTFVGAVTGNATGLSGTPNISAGTISGSTGTFTGDLSIAQNLVHTGDTDTKLEFGTDTVKLFTAGTQKFRIYDDGVVSIGQSSKSSTVGAGNLDIQGNATNCIIEMGNPFPGFSGGVVPEFRITATNSGHEVKFESIWGGDNALHPHIGFTGGRTHFYKGTNSDEIARFDSDKFGINETSPDTKLHITHSNATEDVIKLEASPVSAATGERSRIIFNVTQSNGQAAKLGHIASHTLNNWGGELSFHTKPANGTPNNTTSETMRLHANGYVTKPNQPLFLTHSSGAALSANNDNLLTIGGAWHNVGSHYKTSGSDLGKFIAPVAGIYWFYCMWTSQGSYSAPVIQFKVNGSFVQNAALNYNATYDGTFMGQTFSLSANDYVQCSMRDWNGSTPDPWNTWWGGWLQQ